MDEYGNTGLYKPLEESVIVSLTLLKQSLHPALLKSIIDMLNTAYLVGKRTAYQEASRQLHTAFSDKKPQQGEQQNG